MMSKMHNAKDDVYIIAEIGGNHEGDYSKAVKLVEEAILTGVDAVKLQIYTGDTLVNILEDKERVKHFNKFSLKDGQYIELANLCINSGVDFCASVWNERQIDIFDKYLSYYKIGSGDLTAFPILRRIAQTNKPIILSTGLATYQEIDATISYIWGLNSIYKNHDMIALLQCTSMYPIPDTDANLSAILRLSERYNYKIGYSDHTVGTLAAEIAVTMGAKILELHFTDNKKTQTFRDHQVSFDAQDIINLKNKIKKIKQLMGDGEKKPMQSEVDSGHVVSFRRALYPARDINLGETVNYSDFIALRPDHGLSAKDIDKIANKKANKKLQKFSKISMEDFDIL